MRNEKLCVITAEQRVAIVRRTIIISPLEFLRSDRCRSSYRRTWLAIAVAANAAVMYPPSEYSVE